MLENERISRIRNILSREKSVNVESLSKLYHVSAMTIRRDLEKITRSDERIRRCRGGAIVLEDVKTEDEFEGKLSLNISGKRKIALRAIEEISGDDVIYLDAGTTTFELAKLINHSSLRVTVITNDILIAKELVRDEIEVIVTGGSLQKSTWCMIGGIAEGAVKRFKPNVAFMGCTAIDEGFNVLTPTLEKTTMKPIITRSSVKSFLLADQTKFYKHSPYIIYTLGEFTAVITDKALTAEEKQCLDKIGANMIQA